MPLVKTIGKGEDPRWEHGIWIGGNQLHVECRYNRRKLHRGTTRLNQHLASQRGKTQPCPSCLAKVKKAKDSFAKCWERRESNVSNDKALSERWFLDVDCECFMRH